MKRVAGGEPFDFQRNGRTHKLTPATRIEGSLAFRFNPIFCNDLRQSAGRLGALGFERVLSGGEGNPTGLPSRPEPPASNSLTLWSTSPSS